MRRKITIDNTNIDSDLTQFPVAIVLGTSVGQSSQDVSDIFDELVYTDVDDDFTGTDGDAPNTDLWSLSNDASSNMSIQNNTLYWSDSGAADQWAYANSVFEISGDFDIQIDWENISRTFPSSSTSYLAMLILTNTSDGSQMRLSNIIFNTGHKHVLLESGESDVGVDTTLYSSKYRFTRVGTVIKAFYWSGAQWEWDGNVAGLTLVATWSESVSIGCRCSADFNGATETYFDNFTVNSGTVVWPINTNPNRKKIAITKADGTTQIYGDVELWDSTNEKAVIHVAKSDLSITTAAVTELYIYYDSSQDDNTTYISLSGGTAAQSVWDNNFKAVYHMSQDPSEGAGCILDSTSNDNDGTPAGTMLTEDLVDGLIGKAIDFDGTDDYINIADDNSLDMTSAFTLEAVFSPGVTYDSSLVNHVGIVSKQFDLLNNESNSFAFFINTDGKMQCGTSGGNIQGTKVSWSGSSYFYEAATFESSGLTGNLYLDATAEILTNDSYDTIAAVTTPLLIAVKNVTNPEFFQGKIDYIRISDTVRSADWIKATYYSLTDDLVTFGNPQVTAPAITPVAGDYVGTQQITISCTTSGATIYYTTDGSTPDNTDTVYTAPFSLDTSKTIKAIGIEASKDDSEVTTIIYTVTETETAFFPAIWVTENRDSGPWDFTPSVVKNQYNEGNLISDSTDPIWSTAHTGVPITDTHDPCGYWPLGYSEPVVPVPEPEVETAILWGAGLNSTGCLGLEDTTAHSIFLEIGGVWILEKAWLWYGTSFAIDEDSAAYGCGDNTYGNLGLGDTSSGHTSFEVVKSGEYLMAASGFGHSWLLRADGTLWGAGNGLAGALGDNDLTAHNILTWAQEATESSSWDFITCGWNFSVAIKNGNAYTCGENGGGQCCTGGTADVGTFTQVSGDPGGWDYLSCGYGHTIGLIGDALYGWGIDPGRGVFGNGVSGNHSYNTVTNLGSLGWRMVRAGFYHSIGIKTDGSLWVTGYNDKGQLGLNDTTNRLSWTQVGSDTDWAFADAGQDFSVAIKTDGTMWSCGDDKIVTDPAATPRVFCQEASLATSWAYCTCGSSDTLAMQQV